MKQLNMVLRHLMPGLLIIAFAGCTSTGTRESTGEFVDDSVITTKVKSVLANDDFIRSFQIGVETYKGVVQLSGFVDTQAAVDRSRELARSVKGVKSVKNDLILK